MGAGQYLLASPELPRFVRDNGFWKIVPGDCQGDEIAAASIDCPFAWAAAPVA